MTTTTSEKPSNVTNIGDQLIRAAAEQKAEQAQAFEGKPGEPPPEWIRPPALESFANATYLEPSTEIQRIVERVLAFEELKPLARIPMIALWRRLGRPGGSEKRRFAGVELMSGVATFTAEHVHELETFPRYVLNLYWLHLDDLLEAQQYVHPTTLERHVFDALLRLEVSEAGVVSKALVDPIEHAGRLIKRYGLYDERIVAIRAQLQLWPDPAE